MKIELWPIGRIKPYPNNPRINDDAVDAVAASLHSFGWRQPVVVDTDGVIVCGHTRWKAAIKLGLAKVPVHVAKDLTPEQIKAYRIADNQTATLAEWDFDLLPIEISELGATGFDLDLLGFDSEELARIMGTEVKGGLTDPDDVPLPPDEAVTQPGDLWILGEHRLLCGDSANPEHVDRLLDGAPVHLANCDPPYNVRVEPRSNNAIAAGLSSFQGTTHHQGLDVKRHPSKAKPTQKKLRAKDRPLKNDFVSDEAFEKLLQAWFGNIARVLLPGRAAYIWGGYANCANYPPVLKACGLYFSQAIIWDKMHPVLTRKDFMGAHEWCFYTWKEGAAHKFFGPNNVPDLWHVKKIPPQKLEHLTGKPAELAVRAIQYSSVKGEDVLDLFGGSGSTLIGAEQTGRRAFLMEIDPLYADIICDRFQRFTGLPGVLERTGESPIEMKPREGNHAMRKPAKGYITEYGYRRFMCKDRKLRFEHILVWEAHFGPVPKGMEIHHRNGDKLDNRIENLQLLTRLEHKRIHSGCLRVGKTWLKRCRRCGWMRRIDTDFYVYPGRNGVMGICKRCTSDLACEAKRKRQARRR